MSGARKAPFKLLSLAALIRSLQGKDHALQLPEQVHTDFYIHFDLSLPLSVFI